MLNLKRNKIMEFIETFLIIVPLWIIAFKLDDILKHLKKK